MKTVKVKCTEHGFLMKVEETLTEAGFERVYFRPVRKWFIGKVTGWKLKMRLAE